MIKSLVYIEFAKAST